MGQVYFFIASVLSLGLPNPMVGISAACAILVFAALIQRHHRRQVGCVIFAAVGLMQASFQGLLWQNSQLPAACWRQGFVEEIAIVSFPRRVELESGQRYQRFNARIVSSKTSDCTVSGDLELTWYSGSPRLRIGDQLVAELALKPPGSQLSPGAFPDQARSAARRIRARGAVRHIHHRHSDAGLLLRWRRNIAGQLERSGLGPRQVAVLRALLVGDGAQIDAVTWQQFRDLGMAHVLVISGLHVGLVGGTAWWLSGLSRRMFRMPGDVGSERIRILFTLCCCFVYAGLAGFTIPTQRAVLMMSVVLLLRWGGWRTEPWRVLLVALNSLLLINVHAILDSSLWMSAAGTGLLLAMATHSPVRHRMAIIWVALRLQSAMMLALAPLSLFWFGEASLIAVIGNILLVPVLTLWVVPIGLLGVLTEPMAPVIAHHLWYLAACILPFLSAAMQQLQFHLADIGVLRVQLDAQAAILWQLSVLSALFWRRGLLMCLPILLLHSISHWWLPPVNELAVLDVGQGTAVVLHSGGQTLVYDTGGGGRGRWLQAHRTVLPYLRDQGIKHIDVLVVSHGDHDHSAGLELLTQRLPIDTHLGFGGEACRPGNSWRWVDGTRFTLLNGPLHQPAAPNADSCVLLIDWRGQRFLLAGDITKARERELTAYWRETLRADVLLVGHHGSGTSTGWNWLKWVRPRSAVFSRARANAFGHPDQRVIERLHAYRVTPLDTAISGTFRWRIGSSGMWRLLISRNSWQPYWLHL